MDAKRVDYIARADGWIAGRRVSAGDVLSLTEAEARYEPVQPKPATRRKGETA